MITNPNAIKILCYGDSNTWGQKPDKTGRYPANVRWTGVLQALLGNEYYIIEEGLGSRTTNLDYDRKPGRNGKTYFQPCLESHNPLDFIVIMLGTNDLKSEYGRSAQEVAHAIEGLVEDVRKYGKNKDGSAPQIILISPILVNVNAPRFAEFYTGYYDEHALEQSKLLGKALEEVAKKTDCHFIDAAETAEAGEDGIHFDETSERALGELMAETIKSISRNS